MAGNEMIFKINLKNEYYLWDKFISYGSSILLGMAVTAATRANQTLLLGLLFLGKGHSEGETGKNRLRL